MSGAQLTAVWIVGIIAAGITISDVARAWASRGRPPEADPDA